MHRPNLALDAPPTEIKVGGCSYSINTDYRIWIDVLDQLCDLYSDVQTVEDLRHNAEVLRGVQMQVFGGVLTDEDTKDVLEAIASFSRGYPDFSKETKEEGYDSPDNEDDDVFSFDLDINAIIIAIRNQSGIDLSYRRKEPFHWWEFLLEFKTLSGEHYISKIMQSRAYKGDDKESIKAWEQSEIIKLKASGLTGDELDAAMQHIHDDAAAMYQSVTDLEQGVNDWQADAAGKSTAYVESKMGELYALADEAEALGARIDVLTNNTFDNARARRTLVKQGVVTNEQHQLEAMGLTKAEYDERIQNAEAEAAARYDEALAKYGSDSEAYAAECAKIEEDLLQARQDAADTYNSEMTAIVQGMIKANPEMAASLGEYADDLDLSSAAGSLQSALEAEFLKDSGERMSANELLARVLPEGISMEDFATALGFGGDTNALTEAVNAALTMGKFDYSTDTRLVDGILDAIDVGEELAAAIASGEINLDAIEEPLTAAMENGYFIATENIDWSKMSNVVTEGIKGVGDNAVAGLTNALADGADDVYDTSADVAQSGVDGATDGFEENSPSRKMMKVGQYAGEGLINGLLSKYWGVYRAAKRLAEAAESGARITLRIASPSKVFEEIGAFTGEGFEVGYEKSIRHAISTIRSLNGDMASAAGVSASSARAGSNGYSAGDGSYAANDRAPIILTLNGKTIATELAADNRQAINSRGRRVALGVGT